MNRITMIDDTNVAHSTIFAISAATLSPKYAIYPTSVGPRTADPSSANSATTTDPIYLFNEGGFPYIPYTTLPGATRHSI